MLTTDTNDRGNIFQLNCDSPKGRVTVEGKSKKELRKIRDVQFQNCNCTISRTSLHRHGESKPPVRKSSAVNAVSKKVTSKVAKGSPINLCVGNHLPIGSGKKDTEWVLASSYEDAEFLLKTCQVVNLTVIYPLGCIGRESSDFLHMIEKDTRNVTKPTDVPFHIPGQIEVFSTDPEAIGTLRKTANRIMDTAARLETASTSAPATQEKEGSSGK